MGWWKGDEAGLGAIHLWIKSRKPKPEFCECCKIRKPIDLANISQEYKRDINDFEWLCRHCHMKKDGRLSNFINTGDRFGEKAGNWKGGIEKKYCMDCGKQIAFYAKRCKACYNKTIVGINNPNYRHGQRCKKIESMEG